MREIAFDTETTGLDPRSGHRIVEIGCVELNNRVPTGQTFHAYVNPERDMPEEAYRVHGLSREFLAGHDVFSGVAAKFLAFVEDAPLVIHNAAFDMGFVNAELERCGHPLIPMERAIDTVEMARRKFPGSPASLDALCKRFGIDLSDRTLHGALLDAQLLAAVYLELSGGRQRGLELDAEIEAAAAAAMTLESAGAGGNGPRAPRPHAPSPEEDAAHRAFLEKLSEPIWKTA